MCRRMFRSDSHRRTSRLRGSILAVAVLAVIAAGVLPACADSLCCSKLPAKQTLHSQMPCCEPTIAPRTARAQPVTAASSLTAPQTWAVIEACDTEPASSPRVQARLAAVEDAHHESPPTLFLLNAQFLI